MESLNENLVAESDKAPAMFDIPGLEDLVADLEATEQTAIEADAAAVMEGVAELATVEQSTETEAPAQTEKPKAKGKTKNAAKSKGAQRKEKRKGKTAAAAPAASETPAPDAAPATDAAPETPAKPAEKKIFFGRNKIGRLEHKLGADLGNVLVFTTEDADLEGDALNEKIAANKVAFKALGVKVQNRATKVIEFVGGKSTSLGKVTEAVFRLLAKDRKITTGDKGNLLSMLGASYTPAAGRAMGNSTLNMMKALNIVTEKGKGTFEPSENSTVLALVSERLGLSFVDNDAAIAEVEAKEAADRAAAEAASMEQSQEMATAVTPEGTGDSAEEPGTVEPSDTTLSEVELQAEHDAELAFEASAS
jgi:hypothetical protein